MKLIGKTKERFFSKVDGCDDKKKCWLWTGHVDKSTGHGKFTNAGSKFSAHRISYDHHKPKSKPSLESSQACYHTCMNKHCVNPAHLRAGKTQADRDYERLESTILREMRSEELRKFVTEEQYDLFLAMDAYEQDMTLEHWSKKWIFVEVDFKFNRKYGAKRGKRKKVETDSTE